MWGGLSATEDSSERVNDISVGVQWACVKRFNEIRLRHCEQKSLTAEPLRFSLVDWHCKLIVHALMSASLQFIQAI